MNGSPCRLLEDYLDRVLDDADLAMFQSHLLECTLCRRNVDEQANLDRRLRQAVAELEPMSAALTGRVEARIRRSARWRSVRRTAAAAVAAAVLAAIIVWQKPELFKKPDVPQPVVAERQPTRQSLPDPRSQVRVIFPVSAEVITVPVKTTRPNVTIIWVYSTVKSVKAADAVDSSLETPERN